MKVLFLDNDGVICLQHNWGKRFDFQEKWKEENPSFGNAWDMNNGSPVTRFPPEIRFDPFDEGAIKVLNQIIEETDCEIVVSSDWRTQASLQELQTLYVDRGIVKSPIGFTPILKTFDKDLHNRLMWKSKLEEIRVHEIKRYLQSQTQITHWVAVDDLFMGRFSDMEDEWYEFLENFVHTPLPWKGIKEQGIKPKIIEYLT